MPNIPIRKFLPTESTAYNQLSLPGDTVAHISLIAVSGHVCYVDAEAHLVRFQYDGRIARGSRIDLDGTPFVVLGAKLMECHQGPSHSRYKESSVGCFNLLLIIYVVQRGEMPPRTLWQLPP